MYLEPWLNISSMYGLMYVITVLIGRLGVLIKQVYRKLFSCFLSVSHMLPPLRDWSTSDLECNICNSISMHLLIYAILFSSVSHMMSPLRDWKQSDLEHIICNILPLNPSILVSHMLSLCAIGRDPTWVYNICFSKYDFSLND